MLSKDHEDKADSPVFVNIYGAKFSYHYKILKLSKLPVKIQIQ